MYLLDTLYYLYKPEKRADLMTISNIVAKEHHALKAKVILDMISCSFFLGAMWTEYGDLNFYERNWKNRRTYITTFYNFKLYKKLNAVCNRKIFHEKILFLKTFADFIGREWLDTTAAAKGEIIQFLNTHKNVVAKASYGDSGKEIEVLNLLNETDLNQVVQHLKSQNLNLLEEQIFNHNEIKHLNPTSLNTLRIVTVKNKQVTEVLFAGIRVGGKNAKIDNISQGGKVARINIASGTVDSKFYAKNSAFNHTEFNPKDADAVGMKIPYWDKVIETVKKAAEVVPNVRIVAWDVAVTPTGIDLVEGNESFGSVIMQLYYDKAEEGLKPKLLNLIS